MARWYTLAEVASLFDVSVSTVKRWVDDDKLQTEALPGGSRRRATAASIRLFARQYGDAALAAFGGILAVGQFDKAGPDDVVYALGMVDAGRLLQTQFPALVLVSSSVDRDGIPAELRAAGFDGMLGVVVNDDDNLPVELYHKDGWQLVCRASDDYWAAAERMARQAVNWWKAPRVVPC
jgi:hypothetical protein